MLSPATARKSFVLSIDCTPLQTFRSSEERWLPPLVGNSRMSPLEFTGGVQRCKSNCAVSNSSLSSYLLWLPRRLACRRSHSGCMFVRRCFSSSASSKFSMNCRRNMGSTRSCGLVDCFLRFPWPFLVPSISLTRRILRPSFHAGFPRTPFGSIWWASLLFARRSVLLFSFRHGWQRLWSE